MERYKHLKTALTYGELSFSWADGDESMAVTEKRKKYFFFIICMRVLNLTAPLQQKKGDLCDYPCR